MKKAAAALCVGVGSLSDPRTLEDGFGLEGLAHFVEHMLFMGTVPYPDENGWSAFLSSHGGEDNGETHSEVTCCYFDIHPDYLHEALERFVSFFASPLFKFDAAEREVKAIESEFQQAKMEDANRQAQLLYSLAEPQHPYSRFGWGNLRSLRDAPKASGLSLREELIKWHNKHYSSNLMTLVVLGQEPLDTLEQWATACASKVPNRQLTAANFKSAGLPFEAAPLGGSPLPPLADPPLSLPLALRLVPLKETRALHISWFVKPLHAAYRTRPAEYISHLLGHEGKGSVLALLKAKRLATSLCAGLDEDEHTSNAGMFSAQVELTPLGLADVDAVVELIFLGLGFLTRQGPQQWVWDELRDVAAMCFRYGEAEDEMEYVRRLALSLQWQRVACADAPPSASIAHESIFIEWDDHAVEETLKQLTPARSLLTLTAKPFGDEPPLEKWREETWFDSRFLASRVDESRLSRWESAYASALDGTDETVHTPRDGVGGGGGSQWGISRFPSPTATSRPTSTCAMRQKPEAFPPRCSWTTATLACSSTAQTSVSDRQKPCCSSRCAARTRGRVRRRGCSARWA